VVIGISSRARFGDMWSRTSLRLSDVLCAVTLTSSRSMAVVYVLGSPWWLFWIKGAVRMMKLWSLFSKKVASL
jgi:hypothetical protein